MQPPLWYQHALLEKEAGVREMPGDEQHNPRILEYLATCGNLGAWGAGRDETPWCSAAVNWCLLRAGVAGTGSAAAASWMHWGAALPTLRLDQAPKGAIVVLRRGVDKHHVAFNASNEKVLGGNQGNRWSFKYVPPHRVLSIRWPEGIPIGA